MLNRRYLRIKVFQAVYAYWQSDDADINAIERNMYENIGHTYDLYIAILQVFPEIHRAAKERIAERKKKRLPTSEDLTPNLKFLKNKALASIITSPLLNEEGEKRKITWGAEKELMQKLFRKLADSQTYVDYMTSEEQSFSHDRAFIVRLFVEEIANFEGLHDLFEERSIYWLEDLDLACSMVKRTIENISGDSEKDIRLKELYSAPGEEEEFVKTLFRQTIDLGNEHEIAVSAKAKNWEADRIALSDMILMKMALAEVKSFAMIPVKVTMNEYIEIAKAYSTPKSKNFINGILDKLFTEMIADGSIKKVGRGLIDN